MILLANNNATSTLAGPIGPSATTLNVQSGAGAEFGSPGANEYFTLTMNDAATGLQTEIMWCTNVTGDTLTVIRAQEGTTAQSWLANDIVSNFWTAGSVSAMAQQGQLQSFVSNQAPDTGAVNAIVASLTPAPANLAGIAGAPIIITGLVASNTAATTINLNGFGAQPLINPNDTALSPRQITIASSILVSWSAAQSAFLLLSAGLASSPPAPYINETQGAYSGVPIPAGMTRAKVTLVGAGGGGGGCDGTHNAGGGGGGGVCIKYLSGLVPGQTIAGMVGTAGTAGAAGGSGGAGSATTLQVNGTGTTYTAGGGGGGVGGTTNPSGAGGGSSAGGDLNTVGSAGIDGNATGITSPAGNGAPGYLGMGAGKGSENGGTPCNAVSYGAGGGGSYISSSIGGAGYAGLVIVEWSP